MTFSHSIGSFRQRLDYQLLSSVSPSPHRRARGRVDHVANIVSYVRFLSAFVVKGHRAECQRLEDGTDVDLWAAGCTNVESRQVKVDEFLHKLKDLTTRRGEPRRVWTFVERIQDNENLSLFQKSQHLFEAFLQGVVTWLLSTVFVCLINPVKNVAAWTGVSRELKYERAQQVVTGLLSEVLEIEVKIGHDR
jgi:hypothetical protein